ncbi:MAG: hypothetical protein M1812_005704 [Candelaria pacifica]|nr:MAG: hypothetical protein M1812_005704 [Candelaria pacifica]
MNSTAPFLNSTTASTGADLDIARSPINWAFVPVLVFVTLLAALLSGTTLGIMSLDVTYLRVLTESGTAGERRRAAAILRCPDGSQSLGFVDAVLITAVAVGSLILVLALINSYIPAIRNATLPHTKDFLTPAIISNLYGAFFIDIVGQLIIPPRILKVAFRVMPLIYPIMGIMAIPSFLPAMGMRLGQRWSSARRAEEGILPNRSLWTFIKYHEEGENYGGRLWKETSQCMRGALELQEKYAEDAITAWSDVKKIRLSDPVTPEFVDRLKTWACSGVIVVDDVQNTPDGEALERAVGFLHLRELLAVTDRYDELPLVSNLNLYPIVIIPEDYPLPDLLNIFFNGKSRIAVVVPSRRKKPAPPIQHNLFPIYGPHEVGRNNDQTHEYRELVGREVEWTDELLELAKSRPSAERRRFAVTNTSHQEPLGIITADDLINLLVMENGRDEVGYYRGDALRPAASMWGPDVLHNIRTMPAKRRRGLSMMARGGAAGISPGGVPAAFAAGRLGAAGRAGVAIGAGHMG